MKMKTIKECLKKQKDPQLYCSSKAEQDFVDRLASIEEENGIYIENLIPELVYSVIKETGSLSVAVIRRKLTWYNNLVRMKLEQEGQNKEWPPMVFRDVEPFARDDLSETLFASYDEYLKIIQSALRYNVNVATDIEVTALFLLLLWERVSADEMKELSFKDFDFENRTIFGRPVLHLEVLDLAKALKEKGFYEGKKLKKKFVFPVNGPIFWPYGQKQNVSTLRYRAVAVLTSMIPANAPYYKKVEELSFRTVYQSSLFEELYENMKSISVSSDKILLSILRQLMAGGGKPVAYSASLDYELLYEIWVEKYHNNR